MPERITRRATFRGFAPPAPRYRSRLVTLVVAPRAQSDGSSSFGDHPGVCDDDGTECAGVAYAISRKVGTAVVRNKLRRRLRAAVGELDSERHLRTGWYLVIVHPAAARASYRELSDALVDVLDRAGAR